MNDENEKRKPLDWTPKLNAALMRRPWWQRVVIMGAAVFGLIFAVRVVF